MIFDKKRKKKISLDKKLQDVFINQVKLFFIGKDEILSRT